MSEPTIRLWYPPEGDKFTTYDQTDRAWMVSLGIGTSSYVPVARKYCELTADYGPMSAASQTVYDMMRAGF